MPANGIRPIRLEDEYSKKTGITPEDIAKLRQWLKTQPHLPEEHITDLDLILSYHCCNRSSELAKQVLDLNLTLRTLFTNYFMNRKVDAQIEEVCNNILLTLLPMRTSEGYAIFYTHLTNYDHKQFNFGIAISRGGIAQPEPQGEGCNRAKTVMNKAHAYHTTFFNTLARKKTIRAVFMILDMFQLMEGTWPGLVIMVDFEGVTLGHVARLDLQNIQQFLYYLQEAILVRLKRLHFLNAPSFIDKVLSLMKPFMKKQLMEILHIHTAGSNSLANFVPIEVLPKESGGEYKKYREIQDDILKNLREHKDFFENENKKRVIETLRPGKPKTISDIFGGVEGSFKKLEID